MNFSVTKSLLLLVVFSSQIVIAPYPTTCNKESLKYFQNSIKLHLKTTTESTFYACADEFAKYQTCCETESLKDFIGKAVESDSLRWNNALKNVFYFRSEIMKNVNALATKVKDLFPQIDAAVRDGRLKQVAFDSAKLLNKYLPTLTSSYYNETETQYRKEAQACFDEVSTLRKNSLCLICSGRSPTFFNGARLTIKQRTCEGLIESCYNTFSFMFSVMGTTRAFFDLINALERREVYTSARDQIPYNSSFS